MQLIHPYSGIDWSKQQKSNLHTHTDEATVNSKVYGSDGSILQAAVIDAYYNKGYKILAITDHDNMTSKITTYPWSVFGRDPALLGMLDIQGKELSIGNHIGSLFNDLGFSNTTDESVSLATVKNNGGLAIINHPGRYAETTQFYVDLFLAYKDITLGLEVHNQGDRYPNDRKTWDLINALTIPEGKIVYGYANDDMHTAANQFKTYNFILSPTITETDVKAAMLAGQTYFCYESGGSGDALAPRISNISVDETAKTITVTADSGTISWVTEGTVEVGAGDTFDYTSSDKTFVRAVITNASGITYTQPFAFYTAPTPPPHIYTDLEVKTRHNNVWVEPEIKIWNNGLWVEAEPKI